MPKLQVEALLYHRITPANAFNIERGEAAAIAGGGGMTYNDLAGLAPARPYGFFRQPVPRFVDPTQMAVEGGRERLVETLDHDLGLLLARPPHEPVHAPKPQPPG